MRAFFPRYWLPMVLLAVVGLAGGAFVVLVLNQSMVTRANYDKIQKGMSRAEVVAILGKPGATLINAETGHLDPYDTPAGAYWTGPTCLVLLWALFQLAYSQRRQAVVCFPMIEPRFLNPPQTPARRAIHVPRPPRTQPPL